MTNIERTLIDITVRPNYSGGVYEILRHIGPHWAKFLQIDFRLFCKN